MNPTSTDVHVDAALSQIAQAAGAQNYIWDQLAPVVPVDKQSDKYFIFDNDDFRRDEIKGPRAPGTLASRGEYQLSTDTYFCDDWAWGKPRPFEVDRNADDVLRLDQVDTLYCTEVVNRHIELQWVSEIFTTSVWARDVTGASADASASYIYWSTEATSAPIANIRAEADLIQKATGRRPNRLALGREVLTVLLDHPDIVDRLGTGSLQNVQLADLATLFEVDRIIVGSASYNTAGMGETASNSWAWGKNALLYYVPDSPSKDIPSAMYSFRWGPRSTLKYEDTPPGRMQMVTEVHDYVDVKVVGSAYGTFFSAITE